MLMKPAAAAVLIVGGGVVGLSASLFLAKQGIESVVVERHANTSIHPRARGVNGRTMELMRELGLKEAVEKAGEQMRATRGILAGPTLIAALGYRRFFKLLQLAGAALAVVGGVLGALCAVLGFIGGIGLILGLILTLVIKKKLLSPPCEKQQSPTSFCFCTQDLFEPVLLKAARESGMVQFHFRTEVTTLQFQTTTTTTPHSTTTATHPDACVVATLVHRDTGEETQLSFMYVIGADGARSTVRELLKVPFSGPGELTPHVNIYFEADLSALVSGGKEFSLASVDNKDVRGLFASINNTTLWVFHVALKPGQTLEKDFAIDRCVALVRAGVGLPDLPVHIKGVMPWSSTVRIADNFVIDDDQLLHQLDNEHQQQQSTRTTHPHHQGRVNGGRVFLCGDAAHVMPPWGGFGANSGIQDAHNLAWKLAAVIRGQAHPSLLFTYETERRPVALAVCAISQGLNDKRGLLNQRILTPTVLRNMLKVFKFLVVGYGYRMGGGNEKEARGGGAGGGGRAGDMKVGRVLATAKPGDTDLCGRPGTRMPHLVLEDARTSTLDLLQGVRSTGGGEGLGPSPTMLTFFLGADANQWHEAVLALGRRISSTGSGKVQGQEGKTTINIVQDGVHFHTRNVKWAPAFGVTSQGIVLVRPDGFVAWRAKNARGASMETLQWVLQQLHFIV